MLKVSKVVTTFQTGVSAQKMLMQLLGLVVSPCLTSAYEGETTKLLQITHASVYNVSTDKSSLWMYIIIWRLYLLLISPLRGFNIHAEPLQHVKEPTLCITQYHIPANTCVCTHAYICFPYLWVSFCKANGLCFTQTGTPNPRKCTFSFINVFALNACLLHQTYVCLFYQRICSLTDVGAA